MPVTNNAEEMGAALKTVRLNRKHTVEMVHKATRIPMKFLLALEAGKESEFPAPVYVKGFVRSYCEFLELDFDPFWEKFHPAPRPAAESAEIAEEKPRRSIIPQPSESLETTFELIKDRLAGMQVRLTGLCAALVLGGVMWVIKTQVPSSESEAGVPANNMHAPTLPPVRVYLKNRSWLKAETDGNLFFEGYAPAGALLELKAESSYQVRFLDQNNTSVTFGDKPVPQEKLINGLLSLP